jgi:hypothetical protein
MHVVTPSQVAKHVKACAVDLPGRRAWKREPAHASRRRRCARARLTSPPAQCRNTDQSKREHKKTPPAPQTYHNLVGGGNFSDLASAQFAVLDVCRSACSDAGHLRRCVHADENDICLKNGFIDIRGEEQVPVAKKMEGRVYFSKRYASCGNTYAYFPRTDSTTS